jgi:hypothetical protein
MKEFIKKIFILIFFTMIMVSCTNKETQQNTTANTTTNKTVVKNTLDTNNEKQMYKYKEGDIVAIMKTTNGTINILLENEKAPITTTNFI